MTAAIRCDNCDNCYTFDGRNKGYPSEVSATIRRDAEQDGWLCYDLVDLCPVCRYTDAADKVVSARVASELKRNKSYTASFTVSGLSMKDVYEQTKYHTRRI